MIDFLRKIRGKIAELSAINARFNLLQIQLDRIDLLINSLNQRTLILREVEDKSVIAHSCVAGQVASTKQEKLDSINNLQTQNQLSHNTSTFIEFFSEEKIRLVFLVITPEIWSSLEPVWSCASKDKRFDVSVVLLKSANPEISLTSFIKAQELLESTRIRYFTELSFSLVSYRPHVIFYPLPYGSLYPNSYKPDVVQAMGSRIAYIPYGLEVGGGLFNTRYQYDSDVPRVAWRVFARSQAQLKSFNRYCSYGNGHVVVTGHPRTAIEKSLEVRQHNAAKTKARGRRVILWTPHFTVLASRKWSSFLDHHEKILKLVDARPDLFLLIRPHPFLRTSLAKLADWGHERVSAWFSSIDEKDNVHVDTETDYRPAFECSAALMADAGSFLVEYLHTGKPICYLTGKDDIGLSEEVRNLDCFYAGATEIDIAGFMDHVIKSREDSLLETRKSALSTYFGEHNQTPAESILNEISNNIGNKPARIYSTELPASPNHSEAFQYWVNAKTTFLAPETYYQEQEVKLRDILDRHAKGRFAADIGCGNGRFTEILSEYFEFIEGTDPNPELINEARENSLKKGISNIQYSAERLEHPESLSTYDFVSCMGVTSGLIDDEMFIKSIWKLKSAMRPGGKILLKECLSLSTVEMVDWNGYKAVYRNVESYLNAFQTVGLHLLEDVLVVQDSEKMRINSFYLFAESSQKSV